MEDKDIVISDINKIVDLCLDKTKKTLNTLHNNINKGLLLATDDDNGKGFSEFTLQLLLYNNFILLNEFSKTKFTIEIEKTLDVGKRCDIFIKTKDEIFIIELKYIKIPFLEITHKKFKPNMKTDYKARNALYKTIDNHLCTLDEKQILELKRFNVYIKQLDDSNKNNDNKYETIGNCFKKGLEQVKEYAATQYTMINPKKISYCVIIGLGFHILKSDVVIYKNKEIFVDNNKDSILYKIVFI
jgi:hypothetical protein